MAIQPLKATEVLKEAKELKKFLIANNLVKYKADAQQKYYCTWDLDYTQLEVHLAKRFESYSTYEELLKNVALAMYAGSLFGCHQVSGAFREMENIQYLGSGCFGTVYGIKDTDLVIKVSQSGRGDPWLQYVKNFETLDNPFVPKVYAGFYYDSCYAVLMERLEEYEGDAYNKATRLFRDSVNSSGSDEDQELSYSYAREQLSKDFEGLEGMVNKLEELRLVALKTKHECDSRWDIHGGNVMVRPSTGVPVLTDPLAYGGSMLAMPHIDSSDLIEKLINAY